MFNNPQQENELNINKYKQMLDNLQIKQANKKANRITIKNETKRRLDRFNKVSNDLVLQEIILQLALAHFLPLNIQVTVLPA
jgi:hypothetical protein